MRLSTNALRNASILAATSSLLVSRTSWAQDWVMGGVQFAPTNVFFTEVLSVFTVPPAPPAYAAPVSIWMGVEGNLPGGQSYVLQPVLIYEPLGNGDGNPAWWMQNEVQCSGACGSLGPLGAGGQLQVYPNDTIFAAVWLDNNNPGSCNVLAGGANCNYVVGWYDYTRGYGLNSQDFTAPSSPTYAQGLVFETHPQYSYPSCQNFPFQSVVSAQVEVFTWSWTNLYTPMNTNLSLGWPGVNSNFADQRLSNGQSGIDTCQWHAGVGAYNSTVGEVILNFAK